MRWSVAAIRDGRRAGNSQTFGLLARVDDSQPGRGAGHRRASRGVWAVGATGHFRRQEEAGS
jgi:hypothetical protein